MKGAKRGREDAGLLESDSEADDSESEAGSVTESAESELDYE